ncbi:hypothetical protein Tco_0360515 [Tanacetum coccineum]
MNLIRVTIVEMDSGLKLRALARIWKDKCGKQWKEFLDSNENIGFIFHVDYFYSRFMVKMNGPSDFVNGELEFLVVLRNVQLQASIGVSDNKSAMSSSTRRLQWSGNNTINAEMQQHDCKVNIMLQRHQG